MTHWAVLTGEYPPQPGGVSDYTWLVCGHLAAAGDRVTVFAPPCSYAAVQEGVTSVRLPDHFGRRGRSLVTQFLRSTRPDRVLLQYVPHAFGAKAMNLPFAWWVRRILGPSRPLYVMFHEVSYPFVSYPLRHNLIAAANRLMARWIAQAAERVFVTIPAWGERLRRLAPNSVAAEWLPVPSTLPTAVPAGAIDAVRSSFPAGAIIGHFGTFGTAITSLLEPVMLALLLQDSSRHALLVGRNARAYRELLVARHPELCGRTVARGDLSPAEVSAHLAACDVLVQPYPDGLSSRRTSAMAGLALGVPLVSNRGVFTELQWSAGTGVRLAASAGTADLIAVCEEVLAESYCERVAKAQAGRRCYAERFAVERTIATVRGARPS